MLWYVIALECAARPSGVPSQAPRPAKVLCLAFFTYFSVNYRLFAVLIFHVLILFNFWFLHSYDNLFGRGIDITYILCRTGNIGAADDTISNKTSVSCKKFDNAVR
jgi:hypothetical protein